MLLTGEQITLDDFLNVIIRSQNNQHLLCKLQDKFNLHPQFLFQVLNKAILCKRPDIFVHALKVDTLLPSDSPLQLTDDQVVHLLQKAVTMEETCSETMDVLLAHIDHPDSSEVKMELQSLAVLAAQFGNFSAVRQLCLKYAVCLQQNFHGKSVLLELIRFSKEPSNSELAELLRMGVYVNTQDPDGDTALHLAAKRRLKEVAKLLLSHGACVNLPNAKGKRPVDMLEKWNEPELSKLLPGSPEPQDASLYHAAEQLDLGCAEMLLSRGVLVDSKWTHGRTALCAAARTGNKAMVDYLLAAGAKPIPLGCYWPELPIVHALESHHQEITTELMHQTEKIFNEASPVEKEHLTAQLVSLLHYSAQCGYTDIASTILSSQCKVDPDLEFIDDQAPIHVACKYNQRSVVELLLAHNCQYDLPSKVYGNTPLHYACFFGHLDIAKLLLAQPGVNANCTNYQHETPLYCVLKSQLTPYEKNDYVRESSVIFLILQDGKLNKPGRHYCELRDFDLDVAAQRWDFVPQQTQKLLIALRNEGRGMSLASECRWVIRSSLQTGVSEEVVSRLGLPTRLQNYVLFRDWFP